MWSMHDFPFLKPACSWHSSISTAVVMCWRMIWQKTLLVVDSSVMPLPYPFSKHRVLLHCPRHPGGCVEDVVALLVLLPSASQHKHCRIYRSSTS